MSDEAKRIAGRLVDAAPGLVDSIHARIDELDRRWYDWLFPWLAERRRAERHRQWQEQERLLDRWAQQLAEDELIPPWLERGTPPPTPHSHRGDHG